MKIKESDWKKYKEAAGHALLRLEQDCISKVKLVVNDPSISDGNKISGIESTIARHKSLDALIFNDFRRSTMVMALAQMVSHGLVSNAELSEFSTELKEQVTAICGSINGYANGAPDAEDEEAV